MGPSIQINSNLNYPIGKIINQELQNSVETQIAVAFLKNSGIKAIEDSLLMSLDKGAKFELIVGLDFKTTDPFAMKYFIDLKKKYKEVNFYCYGDKGDNRNDIVFHPKIYLFRSPKEVTSIIGSTYLTQGGLMSNFEVNTVFNEVKPIYYTQLQAIYNSVKFTESLFVPDEEYLQNYSDVFKAFEKNEEKAKADNGIKEKIEEMAKKETTLPGTVPSMRSMLISFLIEQHEKGVEKVSITDIYSYLDNRIKDPMFDGKFKLDTFHNSIRGELNHNEVEANGNSMKFYKRVDKGYYAITTVGEKYNGRQHDNLIVEIRLNNNFILSFNITMHKPYFFELRDILQSKGKEGTTEYERYVDLPSIIPVNTKWSLYQLCYFSDDHQLLAYALNKYNEGKFYEVSKLPKTVKAELISMIEDTFM